MIHFNTGINMSKVSISQAAKMAGIGRSTLYNKYINTGKITVESIDDKKMIDVSELIRVFGSKIKLDSDNCIDDTFHDSIGQGLDTATYKIISMLEQQLRESKDLLKEAKDREEWLRGQLEKTTHLLENKQEPEKPKRKKILGIF
jgi:hypothetical protein